MEINYNELLNILTGKLKYWLEGFTSMIPNLLASILVMTVFVLTAKLIRPFISRVLNKFSDRAVINNLFASLLYVLIIGIGIFVSLEILHLDKAVTSLLAGAGIAGLAIGFAFQDISANFIAGTLLAIRRPITIGDIIDTQGFFGTVEEIDLRKTVVRTFQGLHVIIPNKDVFQNPVTNYTKTNDRRIDLTIGISYGDDLAKVEKVTKEAIEDLEARIKQKEVIFSYKEFGDSSINFQIMFWIEYLGEPEYLKARNEAIKQIKSAFDQNNITIPFPIRTLDFGIKGGTTLEQMPVTIANGKQLNKS